MQQRTFRQTCKLAWIVFRKDWRSEWRTRAGLNTSLLFAVAAPVALSFNLARQRLEPATLAGLLWTVLLFAALIGLGRTFIKEEESGTAALLRLSFPADAVLLGKALFNLSLLLMMQLAAAPLFMLLLDARITALPAWLTALLLGDVGLAATSTLLGAMAAQARARGALFAGIAVPVLLPLLVSSAAATAAAMSTPPGAEFWPALQIVFGFDLAIGAVCWMLFDFVWRG